MTAAITTKKMHIDEAHFESGPGSEDLEMFGEINRIVTDSISDLFFTTGRSASENLKGAGVDESRIFFVDNTTIDTLLKHQKSLRPSNHLKFRKLEPESIANELKKLVSGRWKRGTIPEKCKKQSARDNF